MSGWEAKVNAPFVNPTDTAWKRIFGCRGAGDRPNAWPRLEVGQLLKAKPGDDAFLFSYFAGGYVALDEGRVDEALDSFLTVARRTTDAPEYSAAWLEIAFILAAYYREPEAAKRWYEAGIELAGRCDLSLCHRALWAICYRLGDESEAGRHLVLHAAEDSGSSAFEAEREWIQLAVDGDWDEDFPDDIQPFYLNQYLYPPELARGQE